MYYKNAQSSFRPRYAIGAGIFSVILAISLVPIDVTPAQATTKEELQAQADSIYSNIDSLQTQLNSAKAELADAQQASNDAKQAMDDAAVRISESTEKQEELQEKLGERVASMYKSGSTSIIDVLFGSTSFQEFLTAMDYCNRIAEQNAQMVLETKEARTQAESAKADYERQKQIADEQIARSEALVTQIQQTQSELTAQATSITSEIADIEAEEAAAAEAAAKAAAEAEAAQAALEAQQSSSGSSSSSAGESVVSGTGQFCNPCPSGSLSSGFGYRDFDGAFHKGIDLAASEGTPYYAADSGTVIYATYDGGYNGGAGNWIVISHGNGLVTKYMHSSAVYVSVGDSVTKGQNIGAVGNTGDSYGAHLHFQVELNGSAVSPFNYL